MSDCKCFIEHGNHDFDWDKSQTCTMCGIKEVDSYEKEIQLLRELVIEARPWVQNSTALSKAEHERYLNWLERAEDIKGD